MFLRSYRDELKRVLEQLDLNRIDQAIRMLNGAREEGRHIFVCGNGGSGSTASHFVCDMLKGASYGRERRFRIIALTDPGPVVTAYANDIGYDCVFVEQLKNFAAPGDVVVAFSGSGNSKNVLRAVEFANAAGCKTISLTGFEGGELGRISHLNIQVCHDHMGRIEDCHMTVAHMISYYFMAN